MKSCYLTFRSVTPAQRAEGILKKAKIDCTLQRTPKFMQELGCGYSLLLQQQDVLKSVALLRDSRVNFQKAYLRRENDSFEEVVL